MLYAIFCYNDEDAFSSATREDETVIMERLAKIKRRLAADGRLGPSARLAPTSTAKILRKNGETPLVTDGPFAETKEQLLGFYIVSSSSLEGAVEIARELSEAIPSGSLEVRPVESFSEASPSSG